MPAMEDVVITGVGAVSAGTVGADCLFRRLAEGQSLIRPWSRLSALGFGNPSCVFIDSETWLAVDARLGRLEPEWGPQTRLALCAATEAWQHAGLGAQGVERGGVFLASNKHTFDEIQLCALARHMNWERERLQLDDFLLAGGTCPEAYFHKQQDQAALALAHRFGLQASHGAHGEACAAGAMAIGAAMQSIRAGLIDVALAGAAETMCNFMPLVAFSVVGALADGEHLQGGEISRPFDEARCGFVMGEGSAFLVLESASHAARRGAHPLARVSGFAGLLEACRITASADDGSEYARCMRDALQDAGLSPDAIDHINAHGTSTPTNDACEALAVKQIFGARIAEIPITANKSALGHSLANSGAVEAVLSALTLYRQTLLPTLNYQHACSPCSGLDIVTSARTASIRSVLSNSFGFGGANACLVLEVA
ncbi:MAG: beta-ketoacyl-[acyl-carrier-protein] synthase family protein [Proteobacteria bacterium]|nr:beta-ketoacyl-[acyl-carrier-protein] synthase family protein [Pseudomonadota bacterium]